MRRSIALFTLAAAAGCVAEHGPLSNRMAQSASPYLASAARQPVGWQAWGREVFALAARLDRPLFLFIGAEECGWCDRMDRESFSDPLLGALIDSLVVPIRVDRDERPDLARHYQSALASLAGLRGYPITLFLLPDGSPFFGGTYFPRDDPLTGRGLRQILPEVARSYREQREVIRRQAALARQLAVLRSTASHGVLVSSLVDAEVRTVIAVVAAEPKAREPRWTGPHWRAVELLFLEHGRSGDTLPLSAALGALAPVVDSARVRAPADMPEVSKAQLLHALAVAWVVTGDAGLRAAGRSLAAALRQHLARADRPLFADREACVIAAMIAAGWSLGDSLAAAEGRRALDRLLDALYEPGDGVRHSAGGTVNGLLQDQVQVAGAALAAYAAFGDGAYLAVAEDLAAVLDRDFADPLGGYFDAVRPDPAAPALADRSKQVLDDLLPGANAWAAHVLVQLADASGDARYARRAEATLAAFAGSIRGEHVRAASYLLAARDVLARRRR